MQLFAFPIYEHMAQALLSGTGIERGQFLIDRFLNHELYAVLNTPVAGKSCMVLGAVMPPDENLFSTLLLCHTLKKEGAGHVTALLPYLAYARQDKEEVGHSLGIAWIGELLRASGIENVICIDVHSRSASHFLPLRLLSLSPARLFADEIVRLSLREATIVAPDEGALDRCEAVRQAAGIRMPVACLEKERTPKGIKHLALHGTVGHQAVVVDDILDTGSTLVSCCELLQEAGVQDITIMATHGLFTGSHWEKLWSLQVRRIYCTNTVPLPLRYSQRITSLSVVPLIQEYLQTLLS